MARGIHLGAVARLGEARATRAAARGGSARWSSPACGAPGAKVSYGLP
jgi:hypothetical protein